MNKLFEVEINIKAVICADSKANAWRVARDHAREIVGDDPLNAFDVGDEIRDASQLPDVWDGECLPYGGDGVKRISTYLAELPAEADTATLDLFSPVAVPGEPQ